MKKATKWGIVLTVLIGPLANKLFGQGAPGEIHGRISEGNDEFIPGLTLWVESKGEKVKATTDDEGRFIIKPLDAGAYILFMPYNNADTLRKSVVVTSDQITSLGTINLTSKEFQAQILNPEAVIEGYRDPLIQKDGGGTMTIIRAKDLEHSPAKRDIKQIVATVGGVKVSETGDAYVRGSRADAIIYFVDGMKLREGFKSPPASAIASVAVYTGGVPAKYGDCTGGVVVVETQSYFSLYNEWKAQQSNY